MIELLPFSNQFVYIEQNVYFYQNNLVNRNKLSENIPVENVKNRYKYTSHHVR